MERELSSLGCGLERVPTWSTGIYGEIDLTALQCSVDQAANAINNGSFANAEAMLIAQAASLHAIFTNLALRSLNATLLEQFDRNMRLALKAQGQCRATIETLAVIKNPPVFAAIRGRRRCRLHGGLSTGARTAEGLERIRRAATKHGYYSKAAKLERVRGRMLMRELRRMFASLGL